MKTQKVLEFNVICIVVYVTRWQSIIIMDPIPIEMFDETYSFGHACLWSAVKIVS